MTTGEEVERLISFWGYKEQESNLILPEHDDDDDDDDELLGYFFQILKFPKQNLLSFEVRIFILLSLFFF